MAVRDLLLLDVRPLGADATNVVVRDGLIASVGERPAEWDGPEIDGRGFLLLPGLVDGHAHVDKTRWGEPWRPHSAGASLESLIANERENRRCAATGRRVRDARPRGVRR